MINRFKDIAKALNNARCLTPVNAAVNNFPELFDAYEKALIKVNELENKLLIEKDFNRDLQKEIEILQRRNIMNMYKRD